VLSRRSLLRAGAVGLAGTGLGVGAVAALDAVRDDGGRAAVPAPDGPDGLDGPSSPDVPPASDAAAAPNVEPGPVEIGTFVSAARGGVETRWSLTRPPGVRGPLPVVVALHGHGGSTADLLDSDWDLPGALARAVVTDGVAPFALATVTGGSSFWHERPWGEDAGAMVTDELLPMLLARPDVLVAPVGLIGWSMGGYGVLRLAGLLGPNRVAAVVASSPGLYTDPATAHPDGFVDEAEYRRFSVMDDQADLAGIPVRIDIGTSDPFHDATRAYVDGFPPDADLVAEFGDGGHELVFSQRVLPAELAFLGEHVGRA
jgi:dienelactone hydrolase